MAEASVVIRHRLRKWWRKQRIWVLRDKEHRALNLGPFFFAVERWPPEYGGTLRFHFQGPRFAMRLLMTEWYKDED